MPEQNAAPNAAQMEASNKASSIMEQVKQRLTSSLNAQEQKPDSQEAHRFDDEIIDLEGLDSGAESNQRQAAPAQGQPQGDKPQKNFIDALIAGEAGSEEEPQDDGNTLDALLGSIDKPAATPAENPQQVAAQFGLDFTKITDPLLRAAIKSGDPEAINARLTMLTGQPAQAEKPAEPQKPEMDPIDKRAWTLFWDRAMRLPAMKRGDVTLDTNTMLADAFFNGKIALHKIPSNATPESRAQIEAINAEVKDTINNLRMQARMDAQSAFYKEQLEEIKNPKLPPEKEQEFQARRYNETFTENVKELAGKSKAFEPLLDPKVAKLFFNYYRDADATIPTVQGADPREEYKKVTVEAFRKMYADFPMLFPHVQSGKKNANTEKKVVDNQTVLREDTAAPRLLAPTSSQEPDTRQSQPSLNFSSFSGRNMSERNEQMKRAILKKNGYL